MMEEESIENQLQLFFQQATRSHWKEIAVQETSGKDPFEALSWRSKDDIVFSPYYDESDTQHFLHLRSSGTPAAQPQERGWLNIPPVDMSDAIRVNTTAVEHMTNGADGLWLDLRNSSAADVQSIIATDAHQNSRIFFSPGVNPETSDELCKLLLKFTHVQGALFWESIPKISNALTSLSFRKNIQLFGILVPRTSPVKEIASALMNGVQAYELALHQMPKDSLRSVCFSLPADVSFLETIAKIKALRRLWYQVAHAYGHKDYNLNDLHIHMRSEAVHDGQYAPRENMLKATFASMAAIAGGCDSLTIFGDSESDMTSRWSRNVSHIMREESFLGRVPDALGGSYTVEAMTESLSKEAWQLFQSNITPGQRAS